MKLNKLNKNMEDATGSESAGETSCFVYMRVWERGGEKQRDREASLAAYALWWGGVSYSSSSEWKLLNSQREHYRDSAVIPRISATELLGPLSPAPRRKLGKRAIQ